MPRVPCGIRSGHERSRPWSAIHRAERPIVGPLRQVPSDPQGDDQRDAWHCRRSRRTTYRQVVKERHDLAASLATTWFGADLSPHARAAFLDLARVVEVPAGTEMTREGELTTEFGLVLSGRVALRLVVPGRGRTTILTVEPGDVVGWSAVVPPYRATSTAVTVIPVRALVVEAVALRTALHADDALAASLYPRLLETMARRLQGTRLQLLDLFAGQLEGAW